MGAEISPVWLDNIRLVYERENLHVTTNCSSLIELYSSLGHLIYRQKIPQGESVINLPGLPGGVYYMHIANDQGSTAHKVIHY